MEREANAKVVSSFLGGRIDSIPCRPSCSPQLIWKNWMNSTVYSKPTEAKRLAQQIIEQNLPPKQTRRPLSLLLSPSFFYASCTRTGLQFVIFNVILYIVLLCFMYPVVVGVGAVMWMWSLWSLANQGKTMKQEKKIKVKLKLGNLQQDKKIKFLKLSFRLRVYYNADPGPSQAATTISGSRSKL